MECNGGSISRSLFDFIADAMKGRCVRYYVKQVHLSWTAAADIPQLHSIFLPNGDDDDDDDHSKSHSKVNLYALFQRLERKHAVEKCDR